MWVSGESKRAVLTEEFICSALVNSRQERINALMNKENNNKHVIFTCCQISVFVKQQQYQQTSSCTWKMSVQGRSAHWGLIVYRLYSALKQPRTGSCSIAFSVVLPSTFSKCFSRSFSLSSAWCGPHLTHTWSRSCTSKTDLENGLRQAVAWSHSPVSVFLDFTFSFGIIYMRINSNESVVHGSHQGGTSCG